ncbi:MAG: hypothetical protein R2939_05085 [Kofleriaceae bacterium]
MAAAPITFEVTSDEPVGDGVAFPHRYQGSYDAPRSSPRTRLRSADDAGP